MQGRLRDSHTSGLVEVRVGATRQVMIVYANGVQAGSYLLENNVSRPFHLSELTTLWGGAPFSVSTVTLPDRAGRAIWLIVESQKREEFEIHSTAEWLNRLKEWQAEGFNGAIEIASKSMQGFAAIHRGNLVSSEAVCFNGQNFENSLPPNFDTRETWRVAKYSSLNTSNSWKSLLLRCSVSRWVANALTRFETIAGAKFLRIVNREMTYLISPWKWKISVEGAAMTDEHFFATAEAAAHAYRALLMGLGAQMGFIIGAVLTQRILNEIFEELEREQRAALEAYRLIPAAFSS